MTIDRENDSTFSFVNRLFYLVSCKVMPMMVKQSKFNGFIWEKGNWT